MKQDNFFKDLEDIIDDFESYAFEARQALEFLCGIFKRELNSNARKNYIKRQELDCLILDAKNFVSEGEKLMAQISEFGEKYICPESAILVVGQPDEAVLIIDSEK